MFTLLAAVQKQIVSRCKLYVAFDSISRKLLWPIFVKNEMKVKLHNCIRGMSEKVKTRVGSGTDLTDYIACSLGVKQGDVCSPELFSLFVNEIALEIIDFGKDGATLSILNCIVHCFPPFSNLDHCKGGIFSTAIFNSDIKLSVYSFSCFISVYPFVALLKAMYAENAYIVLCCRH